MMSARLEREAARQAGKAAFAAAMASSTSLMEARPTDACCSPVAGLKTGPVRPDVDGTVRPLIQWSMLRMLPLLSSSEQMSGRDFCENRGCS